MLYEGKMYRSRGLALAAEAALVTAAVLLVLLSSVVFVAFTDGAAGAALAPTWKGSASAQALKVSLAGTSLVGGDATSSLSGTPAEGASASSQMQSPDLQATGSGELLPVLTAQQSARVTAAGRQDSLPQACGTPSLPSLPAPFTSLLALGAGCGSATATATGPDEAASATGSVANLTIGLGGLLKDVPGLSSGLSSLTSALQSALGSLPSLPGGGVSPTSALSSVLGVLSHAPGSQSSSVSSNSSGSAGADGGGATVEGSGSSSASSSGGSGGSSGLPSVPGLSSLAGIVQGIVGSLPGMASGGVSPASVLEGVLGVLSASQLLSAQIGQSQASMAATGSASLQASSTANGGSVALFPGLDGGSTALLTVNVAAARSVATEPADGQPPTASVTPAVATVTVALPGTAPQTLSVGPGKSETLFSGTPLESTISVAGGNTSVQGDTATASSQGVQIDLLQGLDGGVNLDLASTNASVDTPAVPSSSPVSPVPPVQVTSSSTLAPVTGVTSVHTGEPWAGGLPYAAGLLAVGAGLMNLQRIRRALKRLRLHHVSDR